MMTSTKMMAPSPKLLNRNKKRKKRRKNKSTSGVKNQSLRNQPKSTKSQRKR